MPNTIYAALDHSGCPFWRRACPCSGTEAEDGRTIAISGGCAGYSRYLDLLAETELAR